MPPYIARYGGFYVYPTGPETLSTLPVATDHRSLPRLRPRRAGVGPGRRSFACVPLSLHRRVHADRGGRHSPGTALGGRHWDDTDPDAPRAGLQDSLVDQTGDVHAVGEDKRVTLPGTISGGISPEEAVTWLRGHREDAGHPLSRFREQITNVNWCTDVQTRLQALPSPRCGAASLRIRL